MTSPLFVGPVLVIGSSGIDLVGRASEPIQHGTSNPAYVRMSFGGVARNVAENLSRLGMEVFLITAVGDDGPGHRLLEQATLARINVDHTIIVPDGETGAYLAVLDERGNLHLALDDMRVTSAITSAHLRERRDLFKQAQAVFVDANLPPKTLATAIQLAKQNNVPIAADPTSLSLAPLLTEHLPDLWLITPNEAEASALCPHPVPHGSPSEAIAAARHLVSEGVDIVIITMAEFGLGYATSSESGHLRAIQTEILDPTGAGDALTAAVIFGLLNEIPIDETVRLGLSAAALTLRTGGTVVPNLSLELLYDQLH
jgi:pseudouridine kinase